MARTRKTLRIFMILVFLLFWAAVFHNRPARKYSSSNNLIFFLATTNSPLGSYPVPLTAGVIPKRFHSHNDYVQNLPLFKALSYGASSVEVDVFLKDGELLVGHTESELSRNRTLASLYLDPLMLLIRAANTDKGTIRRRGVFETAPFMPLHLLIDLKTDGPSTFAQVYSALEPLRTAGYLSTWDSSMSAYHQSIVTVIGTGNTPLESVQALGVDLDTPRDIFLDAPLSVLPEDDQHVYNSNVSLLASADFKSTVGLGWMIPTAGRRHIRHLVQSAHAKGIQTRFWNTPKTPRNYIWQMLLDEGVDWLNVDDLRGARDF